MEFINDNAALQALLAEGKKMRAEKDRPFIKGEMHQRVRLGVRFLKKMFFTKFF